MNRILEAIERTRAPLSEGKGLDGNPIDPQALKRLDKSLNNTLAEHFTYQQTQARAHAMGRITTEEAQTIYMALGDPPAANGWASGTDLATKVVITEVMAELLASALMRRRAG